MNDDLRVHRQRSLAWATATWRGDLVKKAGGTEHMEGRYTDVLEKRGNEWLVVQEHMSVPSGRGNEAVNESRTLWTRGFSTAMDDLAKALLNGADG